MLESPRISVVIVNYNFAKYLRECIDSVLAQTLPPCEIVIYDDCSTDESWSIISEYRQRLPELIVAHRQVENIGMQANGNAALRRAQCELICWLDGDDRWLPGKLELEWQALNSNRHAKIAYSNVYSINAAGQRTAVWYDGQGPEPPSGDVFIPVFCKRFFPGIRSLFRNPLLYRALLEELDYHDEDVALYIDWDLKLRLTARHAVAYSGEALVEYRIHPGGIHNQPRETHLRDLVLIYRKNQSLLARRTAAEITRVEAELDGLSREYGGGALAQNTTAVAPAIAAQRPTVPPGNNGEHGPAARTGIQERAAGLGENLIFLVSLPRSGSTLLQRILASHPDVHTTAEPWLMLHPLYALKRQGLEAEYESELAHRALTEFLATLPDGEDAYLEALRAMASVLYGKVLQPTGKHFFLDKTPRYYYILPELARVFPRARFVLLSRNPVAVLSSVLRTWLGNDLQALQKHQHYIDLVKGPALLARGIQALGDSAVCVHYEDLIRNPAATLTRVCEHVGIGFQPSMLDYGQTPAPIGTFGDPSSIHRHNTVVGDYLDTWRSHLSEEPFRDFTLNYVDTLGEPVFETLGYGSDAIRSAICGEQHAHTAIRMDRPSSDRPNPSPDEPVGAAIRKDVAQAVAVNPDQYKDADRLNKEGEAAFNRGDIESAEQRIRQAYGLAPDNCDVLNNLVVLHWHKQDYVNTLNTLAEALKRQPFDRNIILNGGQILAALNKENDARILYSSYLSRNPGDGEVSGLLAALGGDDSVDSGCSGASARPGDSSLPGAGTLAARYVAHPVGEQAPKITVVIPSFNQGQFLEETIRSLIDQAYPNLELIVMDGGSTDQSIDILEKYQAQIHYWTSASDGGQYWAVDAGFKGSTGDIMTWINSDDKLHPNSLQAVASIFSQFKEVDWVTGTPSIMNENGELTWVCTPPPVYSRQYYLEKRYDHPRYIQQEGTFWRRSLWEKAGGGLKTSLTMAGDLELWMRFFRHARLYTTAMPLGCFRQHSGQKTAKALDRYRSEALKELAGEITRFERSAQTVPEPAPVIMIADQLMSSRDSVSRDKEPAVGLQGDDILVSAIVSTYNSEAYIEGCLQDLMSQTIADRVEVIVVDSGSQQNERAVVERYRKQYDNIRYMRTDERETIYAAWNRAIREARGEYLTNANTDDRHRHDAYERMVAELEAHADVALVYADSAVTRVPDAAFDRAPIEGVFRWPEFDARHLFSVCYIGPQPMWRRSLHREYGDFDPHMKVAGDYDLWLRLASGGEHFKHLPQVLGLYLQSSGSIEHTAAAEGARESEIARQRNWPAGWGQRPALSPGYLVPMEQPGEIRPGAQDQAALISIIMPTKDRLSMLGRALDSVIAQTYSNWELIVVNDGGESVRGVTGGRDPADRIRLIEFDRSHRQAAARNTAFTVARGEIVCYLDDDDVYLPHHLETIARELGTRGRAFVYTDAVVVKEKLVDGRGQEVGRSNPYAHQDYSRRRLLINNYIPINTWAHKRDCLDQIGVFDRSLSCYEDWEFLLRLSDHYEFHHVAETTVEVRHRVDQVDNVSRRRLAETADAYRLIYARHGKGLAEDVRAEREQMLYRLVENIHAWTSTPDGGQTDHARTLPGADAAPTQGTEAHDYQAWLRRQELGERDIARITRHMMTDWTLQPSIHLIMTHRSGQEEALADSLDSLSAQLYGGWGLSVVSCSPCPDAMFEDMDMLEWRQVDGDLMPAVNAVVMESAADWIGLLDAGTILAPQLLFRHVDSLHQHPEWRLVCTDEDRIGADGQRYDPLFKPAFNLELLRAIPYMGRFLLIERQALVAAGAYSLDPGTEAYDIVFRLAEQCGAEAMGHIADVLVHQQDRFQLARDEQAILEYRRRCVEAHLQRCAISADVRPGTLFGSCFIDYACEDRPPVDIIVPVSACTESLGLFLDSLTSMTAYPDFRIHLLVRNDVELSPELVATQGCEISRYAGSESPWQKLSELLPDCGEHIVYMTPAVIAIQSNWLERLVAQLQNEAVAVVAPRLISADKQVVGGGFILGAGSYSMGLVAHGGLSLDEPGYMGRAQVAQELSAVSTSCLLVRKSVFEAVGGVSAELRIPLYQAIDFCLRVHDTGTKIIWTPHSTLLYLGEDRSALDGVDIDAAVIRESEAVCSRALATLAQDPAYNPNLSLTGRRFAVDDSFAPRRLYDEDSLHRVIGVGAGSIGCWKYRIQQPLRTLQEEGVASSQILPFSKELVQLPSLAELERAQVDTLLMHNTMHNPYMDAMEAYKRVSRTFIVFGQDDLMYAMPPKNPFSKTIYKDVKKRLRRCLKVADRVIVTTQPLAEELGSMVDDIRVIPNYLDASIWVGLQSQRGVGDKPRVGWAGAQQHLGDLELLEQVVRETADEVDWVFFGMCPEFLQPYVKEIHNPVTFGEYPQKLATLNLDLAVAPLEHNRFNECKSSLRLLEYGVLGWPVIASDIAPYRGAPVCRVHNQPRAWIKAIRERCHDLDATRQEGDVLRDWVQQNWLLQQHLDEWLAALDPASDYRQGSGERGRAAGL